MLRFADPYFLLLLIIPPMMFFYRRIRMHRPVMGLSTLTGSDGIPRSAALKLGWLVTALKYGTLVLLVLAMARPQWGTRHVSILTEGINIVLAVDLSESMAALDFKRGNKTVNRLEAVKGVIQEFIAKRNGDRIGVVVFGSEAYTQLPLTRDYATIASLVERLRIGAAGKATAIGDAIGISLKRLADITSRSNIIILLTDGQSNAGEITPLTAAEIASQEKVKIYTIGVGGQGKAPFLVKNPLFGERYVYRRVPLDEETLQQIAEQTGGLYFRAENLEGLQKIYTTIDKLEKTEVKTKTFAEYREYYPYLLTPALAALMAWIILVNTRYLRIP